GTFRPGNDVTRGQLSKIIVLAMGWTDPCPTTGHFSDVPPGSTFFCFIETAYVHGIITGYADGTFRPGNNATRGQISKIVYQAITGADKRGNEPVPSQRLGVPLTLVLRNCPRSGGLT